AWEFYEQNKTNIEWDLVVLNPSFPPIHEITGGPANLNMSLQYWYDAVLGEGSKSRERLSSSDVEIDVRDAALAHVLALQKEAAGGERILITGKSFIFQEWLDIINAIKPYPLPSHPLSQGFPELKRVYDVQYTREKQERIFGMKLRTIEETARDILTDFSARGW
ncbi:NADPH-dependent methylglyoxal reductase GRE2, partial [Leucoagaricus sp. SymC.cos]